MRRAQLPERVNGDDDATARTEKSESCDWSEVDSGIQYGCYGGMRRRRGEVVERAVSSVLVAEEIRSNFGGGKLFLKYSSLLPYRKAANLDSA